MNSSSSPVRRSAVAWSSPYILPTKRRYSAPVKRSKSPMPSGTTPICRFTSIVCEEKSSPSSCMRPDVGASSPVSILIVVDFPAPLGPRKPKNCPAVTRRSTLSTAVSAPKRRVSFSVTMATSVIVYSRADSSQQNSSTNAPCVRPHAATPTPLTRFSSDGRFLRGGRNTGRLRFFRRECREHRRQLHPKNPAALLRVIAKNLSGVLLQDAEADAQAETRAFADRFRSVKGVEHALRVLDPRSRVGKQDHYIAAIAYGLDGQHSALARVHGVNSIVDDVEEHLQQLIAVSAHAWQHGFQLHLDARLRRTQIQRA